MATLATGGTEIDANGYRYHKFTSDGSFVVSSAGDVDYLVVAQGGGGGWAGGGGGAGGVKYGTGKAVTAQTYTIQVGAAGGGKGTSGHYAGYDGEDSIFSDITATGGGNGAGFGNNDAGSGGSGGGVGVGNSYTGGTGISGEGNNGGNGIGVNNAAGGGGKGAVGQNSQADSGGNGGDGVNTYSDFLIDAEAGVDISSVHWIGGGGGGGAHAAFSTRAGYGGQGGGGAGGTNDATPAGANGIANSGGGGGGGDAQSGSDGGNGGTGIVIIRYLYSASSPPNTPTNSAPTDGSTGQLQNPTLTGSAFSDDNEGDTHTGSTWQLATDSGMTSVVWSKDDDATNLTSIVVNSTNGTFAGALSGETMLAVGTTYYWHVKYKDSGTSTYSSYSATTSFTTLATSTNYLKRPRRNRFNFDPVSLG